MPLTMSWNCLFPWISWHHSSGFPLTFLTFYYPFSILLPPPHLPFAKVSAHLVAVRGIPLWHIFVLHNHVYYHASLTTNWWFPNLQLQCRSLSWSTRMCIYDWLLDISTWIYHFKFNTSEFYCHFPRPILLSLLPFWENCSFVQTRNLGPSISNYKPPCILNPKIFFLSIHHSLLR